jgi:adenylate cyclase
VVEVNAPNSVRLEIYVLQKTRWEIHSNFTMEQRDECIEEAKRLDVGAQFGAVCVIRETYSGSDNSSRESVIYHSPSLKTPPPVASVMSGEAGFVAEGVRTAPKAEKRAPAPKKKASPKKKKASKPKPKPKAKGGGKPAKAKKDGGNTAGDGSLGAIIPKLSIILIGSMMGAGLIAFALYYGLQYSTDAGFLVDLDLARGILVAVFVISFLALFVPRARDLLRGMSGAAPGPNVLSASNSVILDLEGAPPVVAAQPVYQPDEDAPADDEEPLFPEQGDAVDEESDVEAPEPAPETVDYGAPNRAAHELSGELLKFVHDSLEPIAKSGHELNAFNKFGMTLYLSGASDYLGMQHQVKGDELTEVLISQMQLLGQSEALARGFCANIEEYLLDPRNQAMYQAGRATIADHIKSPDSEIPLGAVLDDWNQPRHKDETNKKEFVAVLFTDIVGSTALTQARGDDAAQLIVRAHDRVVRDALGRHSGREIKHTGDGIMATFPQITDSLEAAQTIQKSCYYENASDPGLGLGICIGINAGEPIHENNDIFGTPVQMAARVLSKAEGWEIAVSTSIKDMSSGKDFEFGKKGDYELKGFDELVPIYLCEWRTQNEQTPLEASVA